MNEILVVVKKFFSKFEKAVPIPVTLFFYALELLNDQSAFSILKLLEMAEIIEINERGQISCEHDFSDLDAIKKVIQDKVGELAFQNINVFFCIRFLRMLQHWERPPDQPIDLSRLSLSFLTQREIAEVPDARNSLLVFLKALSFTGDVITTCPVKNDHPYYMKDPSYTFWVSSKMHFSRKLLDLESIGYRTTRERDWI